MSTVEEIKSAISALSKEDYIHLRKWFSEKDWEQWDEERRISKKGDYIPCYITSLQLFIVIGFFDGTPLGFIPGENSLGNEIKSAWNRGDDFRFSTHLLAELAFQVQYIPFFRTSKECSFIWELAKKLNNY